MPRQERCSRTSPRLVGRTAGHADYAGIAVGDGSVWVVSPAEGQVVRLDAKSNRPTGEPIVVGAGPTGIAVADGDVWVANADDATITRIDAHTGESSGSRSPSAASRGGAAGAGAVWVADRAGA